MTDMEAGWYRDPAPANPAAPSSVRYWDGRQWTTQVKQASRQQRAEWRAEVAVQQREYAAAHAYAGAQAGGYAGPPGALRRMSEREVTPDGEHLAGWWPRVGASIVDSILTSVVGITFGWSFIRDIRDAFGSYVRLAADAADNGTPAPEAALLTDSLMGPLIGLAVVMWLVRLVYGVGFLKAFQATPGKLLLGLEVRLWERPGPLSWGTVLARWFAQNVAGLLQAVPLLNLVTWVYPLLDCLWPLWDGRRQALHDKVARTCVVRRR
jgi:uncharacterized RDD family membrane protein YckC